MTLGSSKQKELWHKIRS